MQLPNGLQLAAEELTAGNKQDKLKAIARTLSDRYQNQSGSGKSLLSGDLEAAVYANVRMPATFGAASRAMEYAAECCDTEDIVSLLDVGAGSGAATWAAVNVIDGIEQVTCLEREDAMRRIGEKLMKQSEDGILASAKWISGDLLSMDKSLKADMVVSSYVLNELAEDDRQKALRNLLNAAEKLLLIVEPGTPKGFEVIRQIRQQLPEGVYIAAPCPNVGACPITGDDWCHFTVRVARSKLHKLLKDGDAPYEDEKFSYIALTRQPCDPAKARVLRHPITEKGRITLELCTEHGKETKAVSKKDAALFKRARKAEHGSSF